MKIKNLFLVFFVMFVGLININVSHAQGLPLTFQNGGNSFGANATLGTNDNFSLIIETNNTERARFNTSGNFGIGTTSPTSTLHVVGTGNITGNLAIGGTITSGFWNGTLIGVSYGGTGATILGDAGVLIGNGTGAVNVTSSGTAGQVLTSNGSGVDPTFQAVKGTTIKTFMTDHMVPSATIASEQLATNTIAHASMFNLPASITVNKLSIRVSGTTTAGTIDIGIYSEDGQTKLIDITTANINVATALVTTAVPSVTIPAGNYWIVVVTNDTTDITVTTLNIAGPTAEFTSVASEPVIAGTLIVTASTLPTTFDPTAVSNAIHKESIIARFDN